MKELTAEEAVAWLADGGLLAYPTETVWGLAADATRTEAVAGLRAFKGRADAAPISVLVGGPDALAPLGFLVDATVRRLVEAFWPGPLTLILPFAGRFAPGVARDDGAVGVRCSPHPAASGLSAACQKAGVGPLTATSCNRSGAPAARSRDEAARVCAEGPVALLAGSAEAGGAAPSTVLDLSGPFPSVLRWGGLPEPELAPILEELAAA